MNYSTTFNFFRSLRESKAMYSKAGQLAVEYAKIKGRGTQAKPERHAFFRRLLPILDRTLEKCERENGFIYHDKVGRFHNNA